MDLDTQEHGVERETDGTGGWGRETEKQQGEARPRQRREERHVMVVATKLQCSQFLWPASV